MSLIARRVEHTFLTLLIPCHLHLVLLLGL
jgi:hypothetical protein